MLSCISVFAQVGVLIIRELQNPFFDRFQLRYRPIFTETIARRLSTALLSEFGLGHVREYAPFGLILSVLYLILRAKSQHI